MCKAIGVKFFKHFCLESWNLCVCQKYPVKEFHPDGKDSVWDARTGFTVPTHLISYAGVVSCQTHIGNETFKSPLYIVAVVGKMGKRYKEKLSVVIAMAVKTPICDFFELNNTETYQEF